MHVAVLSCLSLFYSGQFLKVLPNFDVREDAEDEGGVCSTPVHETSLRNQTRSFFFKVVWISSLNFLITQRLCSEVVSIISLTTEIKNKTFSNERIRQKKDRGNNTVEPSSPRNKPRSLSLTEKKLLPVPVKRRKCSFLTCAELKRLKHLLNTCIMSTSLSVLFKFLKLSNSSVCVSA